METNKSNDRNTSNCSVLVVLVFFAVSRVDRRVRAWRVDERVIDSHIRVNERLCISFHKTIFGILPCTRLSERKKKPRGEKK